jgi:hypothetical protein
MKKLLLLLFIAASAVLNAQDRADRQSLDDPNSFSLIVMGDPQGYVKYDINQPLLELTTCWIADNVERLNIKAVLCTGDLVEQNENITMNRRMLNQTSKEMWESVSRSFARLDNKVPYIVSCGNHDYGLRSAEDGRTHFPDYFPFSRNSMWRNILVSDYLNREGRVSLENSAYEIEVPNWGKLLIVTTEFAPRDEVLEWAKGVISDDRYKDDKVIFMTHSFITERDAKRTDNEPYKLTPRNWGQQVWDKLIYPLPNVDLVVCGHYGNVGEFEDAVGYREDKNEAGGTVHQMMFNVQTLGGGWEGNGGDGWIRILEFLPDGKTIHAKTYSPLFGISPTTRQFAHRKGECDDFNIIIE